MVLVVLTISVKLREEARNMNDGTGVIKTKVGLLKLGKQLKYT